MAYPQRPRLSPNELLAWRQQRQRLDATRAARLRSMYEAEPVSDDLARDLDVVIERHTVRDPIGEFLFVAHELRTLPAVIRWLRLHSRRKVIAADVYVTMCSLIVSPDGRVNATRAQLAEILGVSERSVTDVIAELCGDELGVVRRVREGRRWAYFINPLAASRAEKSLREREQRKAPPLLVLMGGLSENEGLASE